MHLHIDQTRWEVKKKNIAELNSLKDDKKAFDRNTGIYSLTDPNKETLDSLFEYIFASMTNKSGTLLSSISVALLQSLLIPSQSEFSFFGFCSFCYTL